jgi:hypothetical protein
MPAFVSRCAALVPPIMSPQVALCIRALAPMISHVAEFTAV